MWRKHFADSRPMIESEDRSVTLSGHAPLGREASRSCVLFDRDPPLVPERHALLDLFKPLIKLGRQRKLWSPTLIAVELWGLLTNLGTQRKITRLFKSEPFDAVARSNPRVTFKYLAPYYL